MYQKYTGIILKKYPLGEADELLTIYTREEGKLRVRSVSTRKIKSKLAGSLQSLNEIDFEVARSSALPVLVSVRTRAMNNYLRDHLKKFAHALVAIETLYRLTADKQENPSVYNGLLKFLRNLENARHEQSEVRIFQLNLLQNSGYGLPVHDSTLRGESLRQLESLASGRSVEAILPVVERTIDDFLAYVLEREIKSSKFVQTLNHE